jgi:hypothetical protein
MRRAKLDADAVREIHLARRTVRAETLAARYGVSRSAIYSVWAARNWRRLHPDDHVATGASLRKDRARAPDLAGFANALRSCLGLEPIRFLRRERP